MAIILLFVFVVLLDAFSITIEVNPRDISIENTLLGAKVRVHGGISPAPGEPWLERKPLLVLLPPNTKAGEVKFDVVSAETVYVGQIARVNAFLIDGSSTPIEDNYSSYTIFPEKAVELVHSGSIRGYSVASIIFAPVQYLEQSGELVINKAVNVTFSLNTFDVERPERETPLSAKFRGIIATNFNYGVNAKQYSSPEIVSPCKMKNIRNIPPMPGDDPVDMLIITSEALRPTVEELCKADDMGITTAVLSLESAYSNFSGSDNAEAVRKLIQEAYRWWNPWILWIVGDYSHVPVRHLRLKNILGQAADVSTDLYFATVEDNLNADYDRYFGDSPSDDLFPDMIYARLEVNSAQEIQDFVTKLDRWIWDTPPDIFRKALMLGASVNPAGDDNMGAIVKNWILDTLDLWAELDVYKLYSNPSVTGGDAPLNFATFFQSLREGCGWINHFDHGNQAQLSMCMYCDGDILTLHDISNLQNDFFPVFYSFSCDVNRLDLDNIARRWVTNPNGGGVAMLAHSEKAWSSQQYIDLYLWEILSSRSRIFLGEVLFQWIMRLSAVPYEMALVGLCGSPITPVWCGQVQQLPVFIPDTISISDTLLPVHFDGIISESPIFIGISANGRVVVNDYFVPASENNIPIKLKSPAPLKVFIFGGDFLPVEKTVYVRTPQPFIVALDADWDFALGNDNGIAEQGELVRWKLLLANLGSHSSPESVGISIPDIDVHEKLLVEISPGDSIYLYGDIMPLPDTILNLQRIWLYVNFADGRIDSLPLGIGGPGIRILWYDWRQLADRIIFTSAIRCDGGALVHAKATIKGDSIFSDTTVIEGVFHHNRVDTISLNVYCSHFMVPVNCTLVVMSPFNRFEFPLSLFHIPPLESMWTEPGETYINVFCFPLDSMNTSGYLLYYSADPDSQFLPLTPEPVANGYFSHRGLDGDMLFYYKFRYVDKGGGLSDFSDVFAGWTTLPVLGGFPADLPVGVRASANPAVFDADGDGLNEIFVADQENHLSAFRSDGSDFVDPTPYTDPILWDTIGSGGFWASVAVGDVDLDGENEICVISRSYRATLWLIDAYGNPEPNFPIPLETAVLTTPALYDLDHDGKMEIIIWGESRKLVIVKSDGAPYVGGNYVVENLATVLPGGYGSSAPAVGDFDCNGFPEIAVGAGMDNENRGHLIVWNYDGTRRADFAFEGNIGSYISAGNIDDDTTTLELVFLVDGVGIYAIRHDGTVLDGFPYPVSYEGFMLPVTPVDLDGDGKCEIVFQSSSNICIVNPNGAALPGTPVQITNGSAGCAVGDIDGDGNVEILSPQTERIVAYELDGTIVARAFPLSAGIGTFTTPYIADVDGNGFWDIVAPTYDSKLYVWQTSSPVSEHSAPWSMERGNLARTGVNYYYRSNNVTQSNKISSPFLKIHPNPFNDVCIIEYLVDSAPVKLDIYDITGMLVYRRNEISRGGKILWTGKSHSGVYIVRISWTNGSISKKMFILK